MSRVAMGSSIGKDAGWPFGPSVTARYEPVGGLKNQGIGAEMIADQWDVSREDLDAFSAESHRRAARRRPKAASTTRSSRSTCATTKVTPPTNS